MKFIFLLVACCCVISVAFAVTNQAAQSKAQQKTVSPDQEEEATDLSKFMRRKLTASNQVLEGLVTDDMARVDEAAERLLKMSHAERWRASNDMMYMHHSRQFRRSVEKMQDKANQKSIDGAARAWIDVTMSCIRCHEWVRDTMLVDVSFDTEFGKRAIGTEPTGGGK